jgi:MscS family membrane protein
MTKIIEILKESAIWLVTRATPAEWIQAGVLVALGIAAILLADRVMRRIMGRWMKDFSEELRERIFLAARGPGRLIVFVSFAMLAFDSFDHMPAPLKKQVHDGLLPIIINFTLLVLAYRLVEIASQLLVARSAQGKSNLDERWAILIGKAGKFIVATIGTLYVLSFFIDIKPYLASASFLGAAVALASQKTIANIIGSLEITLGKLFKEGDRISFGEYDGFVTDMGLRCIELTSLTGEKIKLPNKDLVDQQIRNYSKDKLVRTILSVGITYDNKRSQIEKALSLMTETIKANPKVNRTVAVFKNMSASSLDLEAIFWADYKTALEYNTLINDLNLGLKEKFDEASIEFAFPTQTVYVKNQEKAT